MQRQTAQIELPLRGPRIQIRELREADLPLMFDLEADPDVKRYLGGPHRYDRSDWIERMGQRVREGRAPFAVAMTSNDAFAGRAGLVLADRQSPIWEIDIVLLQMYWRDWLGREAFALLLGAAFDQLGATAVLGVCDPDHSASKALLRAFGFEQIGAKAGKECYYGDMPAPWDAGHLIFSLARTKYVPPASLDAFQRFKAQDGCKDGYGRNIIQ